MDKRLNLFKFVKKELVKRLKGMKKRSICVIDYCCLNLIKKEGG